MKSHTIVILISFALIGAVGALRMIRVAGPDVAALGDTMKLTCEYDLKDDTLYLIKWTVNSRPFYQKSGQGDGRKQAFPSPLEVNVRIVTNVT